jgi:hypothetical protein
VLGKFCWILQNRFGLACQPLTPVFLRACLTCHPSTSPNRDTTQSVGATSHHVPSISLTLLSPLELRSRRLHHSPCLHYYASSLLHNVHRSPTPPPPLLIARLVSHCEAAPPLGMPWSSPAAATQVLVLRCTWVLVTMSYHARHLMPLVPEDLAPAALPGTRRPLGVTVGDLGTYRARSHGGSIIDRQVVKSCLSMAIVMGGRTGMDHSWV